MTVLTVAGFASTMSLLAIGRSSGCIFVHESEVCIWNKFVAENMEVTLSIVLFLINLTCDLIGDLMLPMSLTSSSNYVIMLLIFFVWCIKYIEFNVLISHPT